MELFDSHAHLESSRFDADRAAVLARAREAGVARVLTCGSDLSTSQMAVALARDNTGVYAAVGVHGHEARSVAAGAGEAGAEALDATCFEALADLARQPRVVALGEIGLDYHYDFSPRRLQYRVLERQLALAAELGLPVVLHNRESDGDLRALVEAAPSSLRGVLHCFLADQSLADWAIARGLYIGVAGPITFKNVRHLHGILKTVPPERLLVETDCPYLAPHPRRGTRNEPAYVALVAEELARTLGLSLADLAELTTQNACRLFGISRDEP